MRHVPWPVWNDEAARPLVGDCSPIAPAGSAAGNGILGSQDFEYARLRGFDLGSNLTLSDEDLIAMRRHGANVARFLIDARRADGTEVYKVSPEALAAVDRYAEFGASHGFRLVIALQ